MIAQIAIESELLLLHNDRDFEAMAAVAPLKLFNPKLWQWAGIHSYQEGDDARIDKTATGENTFRGALKGEYDGSGNIVGLQICYKF